MNTLSQGVKRCFSVQSVAVVGLGQMGIHMAGNLSKHFQVVGVDSNPAQVQERLHSLNYSGVSMVSSLNELPSVDHVVLSLPSNAAVEQVVAQLCHHLSSPTTVVDTSTISPALAKQCTQKMADQNCLYVDAPVSGGVNGSANATLTFMLGLSQDHASSHPDRHQDLVELLNKIGAKTVFCGGEGMGQSIKLVNNLALAIQMLSICETFAAGQLLGIEPAIQHDVMSTSTSRCWSVDSYVPLPGLLPNVPAQREYAGGFSVDLMRKDLALCINEIKEALEGLKGEGGQKVWQEEFSVSRTVVERYERLSQQQGLGHLDFGVMFKSIQNSL